MPEHPAAESFQSPDGTQTQDSGTRHQGIHGEEDALQHSQGGGIHAPQIDLKSPGRKHERPVQEAHQELDHRGPSRARPGAPSPRAPTSPEELPEPPRPAPDPRRNQGGSATRPGPGPIRFGAGTGRQTQQGEAPQAEVQRPGGIEGLVPGHGKTNGNGDQERTQPEKQDQEEDPRETQFAAFFLIEATRSEKDFFLKYCANWLRYFSTWEGLSPTLRS